MLLTKTSGRICLTSQYLVSRHYMLDWLTRFNDAGISGASNLQYFGATFTAGGLSKMLADGLWSMRINVQQGVIVGVLSVAGQSAVDAALRVRNTSDPDRPKRSLLERILSSKWLPMKKLSDEEYRDRLKENLVKVEAELSMVDDRLQEHKRSEPGPR